MDSQAGPQGFTNLVPHFTRARDWRTQSGPVYVRGEGAWLWDADGNCYLDGLSGLFCVNLGHGRLDLAEAARTQMLELAYAPNWSCSHLPGVEAAKAIAAIAPGDLDGVFFVNSGSEAVEAALKFARAYFAACGEDHRTKVIARNWSYHGTTLGALSVTGIPGIREPFRPFLGVEVHHAPNTLEVKRPADGFGPTSDGVDAIRRIMEEQGPETVAMVLAEPVQNGRGALVPPLDYWPALRRLCDEHGVLLCADEVITGFGRVGHWWGVDRYGTVPDLLTFAKAATSGYVPLGGVVVRRGIVDAIFDGPAGTFAHGSTFGGHPTATAVAVAAIEGMQSAHVLDNVLNNEDWLAGELAKLAASHSVIKAVRGVGFFYAIELMRDSITGEALNEDEAFALQSGVLATFVKEAGLHIRADNRGGTMLILAPPLIASREVLDELIARVSQVLERTERWVRRSSTNGKRMNPTV